MTATIANTDHSRCIPGEPCYAGRPVAEVPARKVRCRVLDRRRNPCSNEQVSDFGLCIGHLAEAHVEYESLIAGALNRHPAGSAI